MTSALNQCKTRWASGSDQSRLGREGHLQSCVPCTLGPPNQDIAVGAVRVVAFDSAAATRGSAFSSAAAAAFYSSTT